MKKKILVIDDSEELLYLTNRLLQSKGYEVTTLAEGARALATIKENQPDLIILDMILPDKDGIEICKELREHPLLNAIPVILTTGHMIETEQLVSFETIGANDYLLKPFDIDDLLLKVDKWLEN